MHQEKLTLADTNAASLWQLSHPAFEVRGAVLGGVPVGETSEMVVPGIGITTVAVFPTAGQGLFVVALERRDLASAKQRPDLLWRGPEPTQIAEAVDSLGAVIVCPLQQSLESEVVAVDAAEHHDPGIGALDSNRVLFSSQMVLPLCPTLSSGEYSPRLLSCLAKSLERHKALAPGSHPEVLGQLALVFVSHVLQETP
jgi:hypothetical protein